MSKLKVDELQESTTDSNITVASGTNLVVTDSLTVDGASTFGEDVYNTTPNPTKLAVFGRFYCDIGDGYPFTVYDGSAGENLFVVDGGDCVKIDPEGQLGSTEFGGGIDVSGASTFAGDVEIEDSVRLGPESWSGQWGNHGGSGVSDCEIAAYGRTFFDIAHNTFTGAKGFDIYNSNEGEFMLRIDPNYLTFEIDPAGLCNVEFGNGIDVSGASTFGGDATFSAGVIINEDGGDNDFRVESENKTHMLFVNAGSDKIGIGTDDPFEFIHVKNSGSHFVLESTGGSSIITMNSDTGDDCKLIFTEGDFDENEGGFPEKAEIVYQGWSNQLEITTNGAEPIVFKTDGDTALTLDGSSQNATFVGDVLPSADNSKDLGDASYRWANLYVADAHYSNVGTGGNDVDGTEGSWTIQEGEEDLFLLNRINGKKFKIKLEEIE